MSAVWLQKLIMLQKNTKIKNDYVTNAALDVRHKANTNKIRLIQVVQKCYHMNIN